MRADFKVRAAACRAPVVSAPHALALWLSCDVPVQMLARAMTRKGNALLKKGDLEAAVAVYGKVHGGGGAGCCARACCVGAC